jgi:hypothetical protein
VALPPIDFKALADAVGAKYLSGDAVAPGSIRRAMRDTGVTLIEVPVRDGFSVTAAAAKGRARAVARGALGARWGIIRRWLRR